jgi:gamma-glutamyltranspeptidase/glutathione hydrolase
MDFEKVTIDFGAATQEFYLGRASVAVPGNIAGLCQMAADYGRLPLPVLLQPAIRLAAEGHPLAPFQADTCQLLAPLYTHTAGMRQIFAPHGHVIRAGERVFVPHLAETLLALAREGAAYARTGKLAQALLADQQRHGGLLAAADVEQYQVRQLTPLRVTYRDYDILLPPPSSAGGVLIAFTLKLLCTLEISTLAHGSAAHLQLLYEVMAATTRARARWEALSETGPVQQALAHFLDDAFVYLYHQEVRQAISAREPSLVATENGRHTNTSHLSVIDEDGLSVSLTTTAGESAGYVVPQTGYIPNNMLGEADLHPKGFHTRPPGERIPTMMAPAIILQDGRPRLVVGSGGSIRIRSAIVQTLSNLLDYQMALDEAVNAPRVHLEGDVLQCEAGFDPQAVDELERMGYRANRWTARSIYFGGAHSASCNENGRLAAAGDDRRGGAIAHV